MYIHTQTHTHIHTHTLIAQRMFLVLEVNLGNFDFLSQFFKILSADPDKMDTLRPCLLWGKCTVFGKAFGNTGQKLQTHSNL